MSKEKPCQRKINHTLLWRLLPRVFKTMPKKTSHPGLFHLNLARPNSKYPQCHLQHSSSVVGFTNKLGNWSTELRVMLFSCVSWLSSDGEQARSVKLRCLAVYLRPQKGRAVQAHSASVCFPAGLTSTFFSEKRTKASLTGCHTWILWLINLSLWGVVQPELWDHQTLEKLQIYCLAISIPCLLPKEF